MTQTGQEFRPRPYAWLTAKAVAWVSGLFSLILCVLLIADYIRIRQLDPLNHPQLLGLREQLADSDGSDEALIAQIRGMDLMARRTFFAGQAQRRRGAWLLLGGVVVFLTAVKLSATSRRELPELRAEAELDTQALYARLRQVFIGVGVFLVVITLFLSLSVRSDLSYLQTKRETPQPAASTEDATEESSADLDALKRHWPGFRGPGGSAVAAFDDIPTEWDGDSGVGVRWQSEVPLPGFNSPIVWGDRVFLSGADEENEEVYCFDADSGDLLWRKAVGPFADSPDVWPEVTEDTGYAAATMATDGTRVFALFGTGDLACYDLEGELVWGGNIGVPENPYGHGSSLLTDGRRLFVQYDHENGPQLIAVDNATGDYVWRDKDREACSWSSPILAETPQGLQLIVNGATKVDAYDPETGRRIWQVECLGGEVAPSPTYANGVVFAANEYAQATALQITGHGAAPLWEYDEFLPEISSPLITEKYCYLFTTGAEGVCIDVTSGKTVWEQEFDDSFSSSPIRVGDRIYVADQGGTMYIIKVGPTYELIASPKLGEPIYTIPAFSEGRIYLRGDDYLYCISAE